MNTKSLYTKPEICVIEIEFQEVIASSLGTQGEEVTGTARGRERKFWDEGL